MGDPHYPKTEAKEFGQGQKALDFSRSYQRTSGSAALREGV
jgi:hypothetical protein